jgi:hypothetical protein
MKKGIFALAAIVVIVLSGIAVCSALIPPNESFSSGDSLPSNESTSSPETVEITPEIEQIPTYPPEPYIEPIGTPTPTLAPTLAPLVGPPSTIPQPSTGKTNTGEEISTLPSPSGMTPATGEEVEKIGGQPPTPGIDKVVSGTQLWILYNGVWTKNPAALYDGDWTYILLDNDQGQWIRIKETYPSGLVDTRNWRYLNQGYHYYRFIANAVGWHKIVAVGSATGESNVIWVYVWPKPIATFTVNAWAGSSYYTLWNRSLIYYSVSKPCYARVTYLKQGSGVVVNGPRYVIAGTHTDIGRIEYPIGTRTVVVDAWTSSGEYAYDVTGYNVG